MMQEHGWQQRRPPVVSIVGRSGSGKTSLLEKLIPELKGRGYRIGTIKHHAHPGFEFDVPGKDTWRHAQAGSEHVIIAAPGKVASICFPEEDPNLDTLAARMPDVDLILAEGYHWEDKPKIEVLRAARSTELRCAPEELLAVVTDMTLDVPVRCFDLNDVVGIADLLEHHFVLAAVQAESYARRIS
jgi:molybdopterin-guanine dinucleotide biosynthesis protein B